MGVPQEKEMLSAYMVIVSKNALEISSLNSMVPDHTAAAHIGTARSGSTLFASIPKLVNNVSKDMQQMTKADNIYQILFRVSALTLYL